METAKLILDYLKILIWPVVVVVALAMFHSQLQSRLGTAPIKLAAGPVSVDVGTAQPIAAVPSESPRPPDVWWSVQQTPLDTTSCIDHARKALTKSGYQKVVGEAVTYGYTEQFVGAVWCGYHDNEVFIVVAGPHDLKAKQNELANAFSGST